MHNHWLLKYVIAYQDQAPLILFLLILLAGANVPISVDIILIIAAFLAATILPEKVLLLFLAFNFGCIFSAWIAYWIGRKLGDSLLSRPFFSKVIPKARVQKISLFYAKYGIWTFIIGRFIPFGVRNCLFMASGMSKMQFSKFILFDFIACTLWSSLFFFGLYRIGHNFDTLINHLKIINIGLFALFSVAVITFICYKLRRRQNANLAKASKETKTTIE